MPGEYSGITPIRGQDAIIPISSAITPDGGIVLPVQARKSWPQEVPLLNAQEDGVHSADSGQLQPTALWDHVYYDHNKEGIWSMGESYKALSHQGGFTYIPFLGSSAPQNYPVHFRLNSATLGGEAMELAQNAKLAREGDRVILDRGPVHVWYDMSKDSVEQSFALNVAGRTEDLVLNIDIETELQRIELNDGVSFRNELGGVDYRHALVIDGAGQTLNLPIVSTVSGLRLTVPGSYLARAIGPVVVDPVLATYQVQPYGRDQQAPDVAYDVSGNVFAYLQSSTYSATDQDVYIETYGSSAELVGETVALDR